MVLQFRQPDHLPARARKVRVVFRVALILADAGARASYCREKIVLDPRPHIEANHQQSIANSQQANRHTFWRFSNHPAIVARCWDRPKGERAVAWKFLDISLLREIDLFRSMSDRSLGELIPLTSTVTVKPGAVIFNEGDVGDAMYMILSGEVRISKNIHGVGEEALAFLKEGAYFGEMALVGEESQRSAAAIAADTTELAKLTRKDFLALIDRDKEIGVEVLWSFVNTLSNRLRESNERIAFFAMSNMFE